MNVKPCHSSPATGDLGLSCALNALGVPPAANQQFQPVKGGDGKDFVRIYLGLTTIDGKRKTTELMQQWRRGAGSVRDLPSDPFSALQVWTKTRGALVAYAKGRTCWTGTCGVWPIVVEGHDRQEWTDPGSAVELRHFVGAGVEVQDYGLAAALILLGVGFLGMGGNGGAVLCQHSIGLTLAAPECLSAWPEMVEDKDSPAAYFAAAAQARKMSLDAIGKADPLLYLKKMKASAWLSQRSIEEKEAKAMTLARKIGL